jgi:hypothetical protein
MSDWPFLSCQLLATCKLQAAFSKLSIVGHVLAVSYWPCLWFLALAIFNPSAADFYQAVGCWLVQVATADHVQTVRFYKQTSCYIRPWPSCQLLAKSQLRTGGLQYFNCSVTSKLLDAGLAMYSMQSASGPFPCMSDAVTSKTSAHVLWRCPCPRIYVPVYHVQAVNYRSCPSWQLLALQYPSARW